MPRSLSEPISNKENSNENGYCESNKSCDSSDRKERSGSKRPAEDQESHEKSNTGIEPHGIDGGLSMLVNALDPEGAREAVVSGISVSNTGGGNLKERISKIVQQEYEYQDRPCILGPWKRST